MEIRETAMENMEFIRQFYKNKKVLLTGHTGFKGTWLASMLRYLEAEVYGFALPQSETDFYKSADTGTVSFWGDIRDRKSVLDTVRACQPELIVHLASHSTVNQGQELTHYIFETNMMGVVNLLEAVRQVPGVKAVLIVTSDKCYRNLESDIPYQEDSAFGAQDPYSASKAVQELVAECYENTFFRKSGVGIATARASNVIGGGDFNRSRLFPSLIHSYLQGTAASVRNPDAVRPWQNVLDVLYGYLLLLMRLYHDDGNREAFCSGFNFGPEESSFVTVKQVAELLKDKFPGAKYQTAGVNTVTETNILKLDSRKAKKLLGWFPRYSLKETIDMTAEFEIRFANGCTAEDICQDYIRDYFGG